MTALKSAIAGAALLATTLFILLFVVANPGCACSPKWKAYAAAVKSDLRNLVTAQESVFYDDSTFAAVLPRDFQASTGVRIRVVEGTREGWRAVATHDAIVGECSVWVGKVTSVPLRPDRTPVEEGSPYCWGIWPRAPTLALRIYTAFGMASRPNARPDSAPGGARVAPPGR